MKRTLLAILALLSLVVGFAQLQNVFPLSIQRFMDERSDRERMLSAPGMASTPMCQYAQPRMVNGVEMVEAFIDIDNSSAVEKLRSHGVIVKSEFDDFVTATVPVALLDRIADIPGVRGIEISKMLELCTDSTLSVTHAGQVLNGTQYGLPQAYDGTGIIVGIIDSGFDYQHAAFRNDSGNTRIVRVYDIFNETGHPVYVKNNRLNGSVFMGEQIDTMTYDVRGTHGTHTASIAAGKHMYGYGGMAPGADIVLCSVPDMNLYITETEVIDAMKYIYAYADSVGKPCVISLSVSAVQGPHDGNDRISKAIANAVGPGRIFVIAAGNNGYRNQYAFGPVTLNRPMNMLVGQAADLLPTDNTYYYKDIWMDTWVRDKNKRVVAQFHILDKYTKRVVWRSDYIPIFKKIDSSEFSQYYQPDYSVDSVGYVYALVTLSSSGKYQAQCYIHNLKSQSYTLDGGIYNSRYQIGITLYPPRVSYASQTDSCYIDSWICQGMRLAYPDLVYVDKIDENGDTVSTQAVEGFYQWPRDYCCINSYAVHDSVISAGAYVGRNTFNSLYQGLVTDNSPVGSLYVISGCQQPGYGPTRTHLPTVMAPGFFVVAAASRYSYFQSHRDLVLRDQNGFLWGAMSGTSMASPTVAGIIAQWLQIDPNLSPGDVKKIFAETAIKDMFTQDPDRGVRFGPNGKIDAMAGARYILDLHEEEITYGDVNGDGNITIKDLTLLINYMLTEETTNFIFINADMNQDGFITIKDLTLLINYMLEM